MPISKLMTVAEVAASRAGKPMGKGRTRQQIKARKDRAEAKQIKNVRAACVERDGRCRLAQWPSDDCLFGGLTNTCSGPSQWMHMHQKRRSQTRGMAPEVRHTTADSLMGCQKHHDQYDGRQSPRLYITALSRKGANGPLRFRRGQ